MQTWKSQSKSKKSNLSSISKMMSQIDQKKVQTKTENNIHLDEDYYEKLAQPRSKKYIQLVQEQMEISCKMEDIEQKLQKIDAVLQQTEEKSVEAVTPQEPAKVNAWWKEDENASLQLQETAETKAWWEMSVDEENIAAKEREQAELQRQREELESQYRELQEQLAESKRRLEEELPVTSGLLGWIYPSSKEQRLLQYGVIPVPGAPYESPEDLIEQVQPPSLQAKQQWLKGDAAYRRYDTSEILVVEVYLYAICVVYDDGTTKVLRDEQA